MTVTLHLGDCRDVLPTLPDNSADSIVTDPPYDLTANKKGGSGEASLSLKTPYGRHRITTGGGFMGKEWDATGVPHDPATWREALRVLKPGGYLLAFGGTRTYHRLVCAIDDAGFEIRDTIAWVYGSGFPKSLDVSKTIDKAVGAEREVMGRVPKLQSYGYDGNRCNGGDIDRAGQMAITAPATPDAERWQGWGTALKPAMELIVMARKPLGERTVAANVLEWGCGGLNVDGCRVETSDTYSYPNGPGGCRSSEFHYVDRAETPAVSHPLGRWPANVTHDGSDEVVGLFPETKGGTWNRTKGARHFNNNGEPTDYETQGTDSSTGSAARFFYCAPPDVLCTLCDLPVTEWHGIMNETQEAIPCQSNASSVDGSLSQSTITPISDSVAIPVPPSGQHNKGGKSGQSRSSAQSAEQYSTTSPATGGNTVPRDAVAKRVAKLAQNARSAGNLCEQCATSIAQGIVAMQQGQDQASVLGQVSISEHKRQILMRCLASFVALLGDTDTIPTMDNLSLLFGSVYHAIANSTESPSGQAASETCQTRFRYVSKASKRDRDEGCDELEAKHIGHYAQDEWSRQHMGNTPDADRKPIRNFHPTVKPTALMRYLCRLVTPPGGVVLDPFTGSGSTGKAAVLEGFGFVGIEKEAEYLAIAERRIEHARMQPALMEAAE